MSPLSRWTIGVAAASLIGVGCNASNASTCQTSVMCRGTAVQVCCTTTQCEYRHEDRTYPCAGTNCVAAANDVSVDCPCLVPLVDAAVYDGGPPTDAATDAASDAGPARDAAGPALDASGCVR